MRKFGYFAAGLLIILLAALGLSACSSIGFPDTGSGKEQQEDQDAATVIGSGRQTLKIVSGSEIRSWSRFWRSSRRRAASGSR